MPRLLASRDPGVVREALLRRGMDESSAASAADGLRAVTVFVDEVDEDSKRLLSQAALSRGLGLVTGGDWLALSGAISSLGGLARSDPDTIPESLTREIGIGLNRISEVPQEWKMARGSVALEGPVVVGILNVTPDSFSDGGRYLDLESAISHLEHLIESGAEMIDVGAESTRPGSTEPISVDEEWSRLEQIIEYTVREHQFIPLSVDTIKSEIAERALDRGAWAINDVSTLRLDPRIAEVCSLYGAGLILNHSRGPFARMAGYRHANYADVTREVATELMHAVGIAVDRGLDPERGVIDPGLGFSKTPEQSLEVLRGLPFLASLGMPIMVGPSRKRFLGEITGRAIPERDNATAAACVAAFARGAYLFRVHDVARVKEALAVADAFRS